MSPDQPGCWPHHIVLETPHGSPTVTGTCKLCGHTRTYGASEESMLERGGMLPLWNASMTIKRSRARKPSTCPRCAKQFASASGRATHERTCGSESPKCPDCGGAKATRSSMTCRPCRAKRSAATLRRRQAA